MALTFNFGYQADDKRPATQRATGQNGIRYYETVGTIREVCLISSSGTMVALNYANLVSRTYSPDDNTINLTFTSHEVILRGDRLDVLFDQLSVHRVKTITETGQRYAQVADEAAPLVKQITVKKR